MNIHKLATKSNEGDFFFSYMHETLWARSGKRELLLQFLLPGGPIPFFQRNGRIICVARTHNLRSSYAYNRVEDENAIIQSQWTQLHYVGSINHFQREILILDLACLKSFLNVRNRKKL